MKVEEIKKFALEQGFMACGISKVEELTEESVYLSNWLDNNMHGEMHYMANHFEKRINPAKLVEGAKSVVSVLLNYYNEDSEIENHELQISKYAWGEDYHIVLKEKLFELFDFIKEKEPSVNGRAFVDSAPVMDKVWAQRAGLGWIGKNTCLIRKNEGSFFFIGELILDIEIPEDKPAKNYCGNCTKCLDACPSGALSKPYVLDSRKCISYLTIELKSDIPDNLRLKNHPYVFGCDICQKVCPWNRFSKKASEESFKPLSIIASGEYLNIEKSAFKKVFEKSPICRIKYEKFLDNMK